MNILVTGASSVIGSAVAAAFASGNQLFLTGRDESRLKEAENLCRAGGAHAVISFTGDLSAGEEPILKAINGKPIHLLIHAASSLSRLRDEEIPNHRLCAYIQAEILTPLALVQRLISAQSEPMALLFISSVLAILPTPRRAIYGRLKAVLEQSFLAFQPQLKVRILRVSKVIDKDDSSVDLGKVSKVARRAMQETKTIVSYGISGRFLSALYYTQPIVFGWLMNARRMLQRARSKS